MYRLVCLRRFCSSSNNLSGLSITQLLNEKPLGVCKVEGWVRSARKQKDRAFIDLGDGSGPHHLQVVAPRDILPPHVKFHSAVRIVGDLQKSSHPKQEIELIAQSVEVLGSCGEPYPLQPRKHFSMNFVRQQPGYKAKTNSIAALLRIRSQLTQAINNYFIDQGFLHIHTPVLTSNDCEGGGQVFKVSPKPEENPSPDYNTMFTKGVQQLMEEAAEEPAELHPAALHQSQIQPNQNVQGLQKILKGKTVIPEEYFDKPVFLTVSGQLHLEALCNGIKKVYSINPAFRAEKGRTRRHLSEFWMVEAEVAFLDNLPDLLYLIEDLVKHSAKSLLQSSSEDLEAFARASKGPTDRIEYLQNLIKSDFKRVTFREASSIIEEKSKLPRVEDDLSRDHELFLCDHLGGPVFVYNWPKSSKPFYMRACEEDPELVSCADLLVPRVGELCGGSLREYDHEALKERVEDAELDWYVDLRSKGSAPTAGFGLGLERLIQWFAGVENIKDTIPFYRSSHECQL